MKVNFMASHLGSDLRSMLGAGATIWTVTEVIIVKLAQVALVAH